MTTAVWVVVAVAALVGVGALAWGARSLAEARSEARETPQLELAAASADDSAVATAAAAVEVPSLAGLEVSEAQMVLSAAGFAIQLSSESTSVPGGVEHVVTQDPDAGVLAEPGSTVRLVVRSEPEPVATAPAQKSTAPAPKSGAPDVKPAQFVVCIDPGHQGRSDSSPEPIGPGSKSSKPSVTGGATGAGTRVPEYEVVLQISMNLKKRLEARGVKVVMTRTTNDVNLSNSERAKIANKAKADLFVRIHADGSPDGSVSGLSTLYPGKNAWTEPISASSKRAATKVHRAVIATTGAVDRGVKSRTDLSGFNWSKVPAVLVETGFLSNRTEDKLLVSPHYQDKLAEGIANGVMGYLESEADR
jgi:N-acetylmuramoyl-L-alanine amidase